MRYALITQCGATCPVGHDHGMLGSGDLFVIEGDALHQANRIDALLVADADQIVSPVSAITGAPSSAAS